MVTTNTNPSHPLIELRRLYRYYGETKAVHDVSFEVCAGQVFGFIGPNGAGKTTAMRVLATLDDPTAGDAFIDGFSVIDDPDRVRRRLGFMPDYFGTYPNINVKEYLDFFARAYGLRGRERIQAVGYVMDFTLLNTLAEKPINGLSKGMKQRLCLGRTMIHDPSVLILDEPAAGLDPRARIEVRAMIAQLAEAGKAVLISSHILTELAEVCHTVGIIEQGRLLAVGSVDEISRDAAEAQSGQSQSLVRVRLLGGAGSVGGWLEQRDDVFGIQLDGELVTFSHNGDRESEVALLREMILADFPVAEFGTKAKSLEDVFLHVTEGKVQ